MQQPIQLWAKGCLIINYRTLAELKTQFRLNDYDHQLIILFTIFVVHSRHDYLHRILHTILSLNMKVIVS